MKRFAFLILLIGFFTRSQEDNRFKDEVREIQNKYETIWDSSRNTVVFTGSSSIRSWNNLQDVFPEYQIINSGFGGSQASDLLFYLDELVLQYQPKQVFIYEGDNDISFKKKPRQIKRDMLQIIDKIKVQDSDTNVVLIAAKPSLARWHLRRKYKKLNRKFKRLAKHDPNLEYANIWNTMLNGHKVREDIFIADGLHMNAKGYELWHDVLKQFIK